jgi:hypothetical protein
MAYVDTGTLGPFTLLKDWFTTWGYSVFTGEGNEFASGQWFRMAFSLAPQSVAGDNLPGTSVSIADGNAASGGRYGEAVIIDENGNAYPALTVVNSSETTGAPNNIATGYYNWLSAPQLGE